MAKMTEAEIAARDAFLSRKGATKVAAGATTLTSRDVYLAIRGLSPARESAESREMRARDAHNEARYMGASRETAMDEYNHEKCR